MSKSSVISMGHPAIFIFSNDVPRKFTFGLLPSKGCSVEIWAESRSAVMTSSTFSPSMTEVTRVTQPWPSFLLSLPARARKRHGRLRRRIAITGKLKVSASGTGIGVEVVDSVGGGHLLFLPRVQDLPSWQTANRKNNVRLLNFAPVRFDRSQPLRSAQPCPLRAPRSSACLC